MHKSRLEAFSDGVIAIIITIMVLEIRAPHGTQPADLLPLLPVFLSYVLSFVNIGIYWNNHHHLLQAATKVNGRVLWANMHLLFWLSLFPFATSWMGDNHIAPWPVAFYGMVLMFAGAAYYILSVSLIELHGKDSVLAASIGKDFKAIISVVFYLLGTILSCANTWISIGLYVTVAIIWLIPDRRIENNLKQ